MKTAIIECSSVYDIDFSAVVFSMRNESGMDYEIYLNDESDVTSAHRKYISRLAIPTLDWEIDPNGLLRQIHLPIENLTGESFVETVRKSSERHWAPDKRLVEGILNNLYRTIKANTRGINSYIRLIEYLLERIGGHKVTIEKFSTIRRGQGYQEKARLFMDELANGIFSQGPGEYVFDKGGAIVFKTSERTVETKMIRYGECVQLIDNNGESFDIEEARDSNYIRLRGPLESVFLCFFGTLIDMPWYMDGLIDASRDFGIGIEYISPISTSSSARTSALSGGGGGRLVPSGYSLIDYESRKVLDVLVQIYPLDGNCLDDRDLFDWRELIDNYPASKQKLSKCRLGVRSYCKKKLKQRFEDIVIANDTNFMSYSNYLLLGVNLIDATVGCKILREYLNPRTPQYSDDSRLVIFKGEDVQQKLNYALYQIKFIYEKAKAYLDFFDNGESSLKEAEKLLHEIDGFGFPLNANDEADNLFYAVHTFTKLEHAFEKLTFSYYEIAAFISGVLLKANIYSASIILGDDYRNLIDCLLEKRCVKKLYFKPNIYRGIV